VVGCGNRAAIATRTVCPGSQVLPRNAPPRLARPSACEDKPPEPSARTRVMPAQCVRRRGAPRGGPGARTGHSGCRAQDGQPRSRLVPPVHVGGRGGCGPPPSWSPPARTALPPPMPVECFSFVGGLPWARKPSKPPCLW
jgi:hypothetical protein